MALVDPSSDSRAVARRSVAGIPAAHEQADVNATGAVAQSHGAKCWPFRLKLRRRNGGAELDRLTSFTSWTGCLQSKGTDRSSER